MKKKILSLIVAICMMFSCFVGLVACDPAENKTGNEPAQQEQTENGNQDNNNGGNQPTYTEADVVGTYKIGDVAIKIDETTTLHVNQEFIGNIVNMVVAMVDAIEDAQEAQEPEPAQVSEVEEEAQEPTLAEQITGLIWGVYSNARITLTAEHEVEFSFADGYELDQDTLETMIYGLVEMFMTTMMPGSASEEQSAVMNVNEQEEEAASSESVIEAAIENMVTTVLGIISNLEFNWALANDVVTISLDVESLPQEASAMIPAGVVIAVELNVGAGKLTQTYTKEMFEALENLIPDGESESQAEAQEASEVEEEVEEEAEEESMFSFESITIELTKVVEEAAAE